MKNNLLLFWIVALIGFCPHACHADLPTLTVLHTFASQAEGTQVLKSVNTDGGLPRTPLMQGRDGMLYGMTWAGGEYDQGVIFRVSTAGTNFAILHSFATSASVTANATNSDGTSPSGSLAQDRDGIVYGALAGGGTQGGGTLFRMRPDGSGFAVIHTFKPFGDLGINDGGSNPLGITLGSDGLLYGATALGGQNGEGIIYSVETSGANFRIVHTFSEAIFGDHVNSDGAHPQTALATVNGDIFYGTTLRGGKYGCGVIYKIMAGGKQFSLLYSIRNEAKAHKNSAADPDPTLCVGQDGVLYGNTQQDGDSDGGAIFKVNGDGTQYTVLHNFSSTDGGSADGSLPVGPLVVAKNGLLYGLTGEGGTGEAGILFHVSKDSAKFFVQHCFEKPDQKLTNIDGGFTLAGLTLGNDNNLYGVSTNGGANGTGTIFRVALPTVQSR